MQTVEPLPPTTASSVHRYGIIYAVMIASPYGSVDAVPIGHCPQLSNLKCKFPAAITVSINDLMSIHKLPVIVNNEDGH